MHARTKLTLVAVAAAIVANACTSSGATSDKAGGSGEPDVLRLANTSGELDLQPAVEYFANRVEELSGGDVRIEAVDGWGDFAPDAEQQVVRAVSTGKVDLGWVGTRVFDTLGVKSFQALTAPMLVDSYALQNAVIESGITEQMIEGLDDVGVVGLGVLPDGLRKPIGVAGPILGPADWRGITFGTLRSSGQAEAIRALGATPAQVFGSEREEALEEGTIQGFEFSLNGYSDPRWLHLAPYVTSNVNLWPQMDVLLANPAGLAALTAEQRGWLEEAARDAAGQSAALADKDAQTLGYACGSGARFAEASAADLAALESAFAPVYANLQQHPETKAFIERIQAFKESTPPEPSLTIPSECIGKTPEATGGGGTPTNLNGTYRYEITLEEARKADQVFDDVYPVVITVTLEDGDVGNVQRGCFGAGAAYSIEDNRITFDKGTEYGYTMTFTFSADDHGNLHLTPVPPIHPGDAFFCSSQVWTKLG